MTKLLPRVVPNIFLYSTLKRMKAKEAIKQVLPLLLETVKFKTHYVLAKLWLGLDHQHGRVLQCRYNRLHSCIFMFLE